jgi:deoxyribodipyrimidine photo-lyase
LALKIINNIKNNTNYVEDRNNPSASTTKLSAYLKFGCLSIREVFFKIKEELKQKSEELIRQLYWRDFYLSIVYHYPHVVNNAMKPKYDKVQWANNQSHILAW